MLIFHDHDPTTDKRKFKSLYIQFLIKKNRVTDSPLKKKIVTIYF